MQRRSGRYALGSARPRLGSEGGVVKQWTAPGGSRGAAAPNESSKQPDTPTDVSKSPETLFPL